MAKNAATVELFECSVQAGFPAPVADYSDGPLDLNSYLIKNPAATFFVRVSGESMLNAGIHPNDILIVDRSLTPSNNKIVIAVIDGELTVKRLRIFENQVRLIAENPNYDSITINSGSDFQVWGVVTAVIHKV